MRKLVSESPLLASIRYLHSANRITASDFFRCIHVTLEEVHIRILFGQSLIGGGYGMAWSTPVVVVT